MDTTPFLLAISGQSLASNGPVDDSRYLNLVFGPTEATLNELFHFQSYEIHSRTFLDIVRVHYFVRGGFVGYRSRASSKHLSPHLPVGSLDSSGSKQGCAGSEVARVGVESTKKPTPDVVVVFET
ncbi:hypothetical protein TNCV_4822671 [Trichonephila clavipes]|nr:hypothetical protein TNCV_4822671 [Trichonephila clavipes]